MMAFNLENWPETTASQKKTLFSLGLTSQY